MKNRMKETWIDIKGYEGLYQINNFGIVKRLEHKRCDRNQILKERIVKTTYPKDKWYPYLSLCKEGKYKKHTIHRLIAEAFIPNPNNYPCINHKDGNKHNNNVENLEWCDRKYNVQYSQAKKINQYDLKGNFVKQWLGINNISRCLKINAGSICMCCKGKRKTVGGYIWKYADKMQELEKGE